MTARQQLNIIRLADVPTQAWKNGGGQTRELLVWPPRDPSAQRSGADWVLRVSVADIGRDGPFSAYPGIDRGFAVLSGTGVRLELDGSSRILTPDDEPICFPGESAPHCSLLADATQDLNLMVQRSKGQLGIDRARPGAPLDGPHAWRGLFTASAASLTIDGQTWSLEPQTLLWQANPSRPWRLLAGHAAYWLSLKPV
jgi:environmental stress-induced protein Ves